MDREFDEFNEEDLSNVLGGLSHQPAEEKSLENSDFYRKKRIDELKKEKEKLEQSMDISIGRKSR